MAQQKTEMNMAARFGCVITLGSVVKPCFCRVFCCGCTGNVNLYCTSNTLTPFPFLFFYTLPFWSYPGLPGLLELVLLCASTRWMLSELPCRSMVLGCVASLPFHLSFRRYLHVSYPVHVIVIRACVRGIEHHCCDCLWLPGHRVFSTWTKGSVTHYSYLAHFLLFSLFLICFLPIQLLYSG